MFRKLLAPLQCATQYRPIPEIEAPNFPLKNFSEKQLCPPAWLANKPLMMRHKSVTGGKDPNSQRVCSGMLHHAVGIQKP
ncbi:MAG: hypothetical protein WCO57_16600 [Verrucomicrobiota bacterium]